MARVNMLLVTIALLVSCLVLPTHSLKKRTARVPEIKANYLEAWKEYNEMRRRELDGSGSGSGSGEEEQDARIASSTTTSSSTSTSSSASTATTTTTSSSATTATTTTTRDLSPLFFHVSQEKGSDSYFGTELYPFKTISRCVKKMNKTVYEGRSSVCIVQEGVYNEHVVVPGGGPNITRIIRAAPGHKVQISGVDTLHFSSILKKQGCVSTISLQNQPELADASQLFFNNEVMIPARWPNLDISKKFEAYFERDSWEKVNTGSVIGKIYDDKIGGLGFSLNGALATLNIAHQFYTWTRPVENHTAGGNSFEYFSGNLEGLAGYSGPNLHSGQIKRIESQNQFFLSGKREFLDSAGEWFVDQEKLELYIWTPTCSTPTPGSIRMKARDWAISNTENPFAHKPECFDEEEDEEVSRFAVGGNCTHLNPNKFSTKPTGEGAVILQDIDIFGAAVSMEQCDGCGLWNVNIKYPSYMREIPEERTCINGAEIGNYVNGIGGMFINMSIMYTNNIGIKFFGSNHTIDMSEIGWVGSLGSLDFIPIKAQANHFKLLRTEVHHFGNAGINIRNPNIARTKSHKYCPMPAEMRSVLVAYCDIHHGGLVSEDNAGLYTGGWESAETVWHHNTIHDHGDICARFDDQARNVTAYNNIIYNCGRHGFMVKGDGHHVHNNIIFNTSEEALDLALPLCTDPYKADKNQYPLTVQNKHSLVYDNTFVSGASGIGISPGWCDEQPGVLSQTRAANSFVSLDVIQSLASTSEITASVGAITDLPFPEVVTLPTATIAPKTTCHRVRGHRVVTRCNQDIL
eukprot:m.97269 g.97269  ORF g.97269 m.97269 type:complete len:803 (+) comp13586_c2_seq1:247-2655(+)